MSSHMTTSSAPGKIILFGEHAVVYGRPALAVPVTQVQATATVSENSRGGIWIEAPNINLSSELSSLAPDHPLVAVVTSVFSALGIVRLPACTIYLQSTIPVAAGLGSGAAVSVAILRALSAFLGQPLSDEQVNGLTFKVEKLYHGTPSGIDNTVVTYAKPVYFVKGQPVEIIRVDAPFTIVIGDTGISVPTKESVGTVRKLWKADSSHWERVFDRVGEIVWNARQAIERGDIAELGALMDDNHALLKEMNVSSVELDYLTEAARKSGAHGAKLSGGGHGGNMIALVQKDNAQAVAEALLSAGAKRTIITTIQTT
ncbi:MAG: mevalonate kinase [Chloroflexota bacterium]